jgi:two-component system sensor histidine kinase/response regulator
MKYALVLLWIGMLCLSTSLSSAQTRNVLESELLARQPIRDSLEKVLASLHKTDTQKINLLDKLSREYMEFDDIRALYYAQQQLELATQIGFTQGKAYALYNKGSILDLQSHPKEAKIVLLEAAKLFKKLDMKDMYAATLINLGVIFDTEQNYPLVLQYTRQALLIFQSIQPQTIKLKTRLGVACNNMGFVLIKLKQVDSSFSYLLKSRQIFEQARDSINLAYTLQSLAVYYQEKKEYQKALSLLHSMHNFVVLNKDWANLREYNRTLSEVYQAIDSSDLAIRYRIEEMAAKDSLFNETKTREIALLNVRFQLQSKEEEIQDLHHLQRYQSLITLLIVLLVTSVALGFYLRKRQVEKLNLQLSQQKNEISFQKEKLQQQHDQLLELNQLKDRIFAILSHDLRGPLHSLNQTLTLLNMGLLSENERQIVMEGIEKQSLATAAMLENLLYWAKSQLSGKQSFNPKPFKILQLVQEQVDLWSRSAALKQIQLYNHVPPELVAEADKDMIRLIVRNLVGNAIKFTPLGGQVDLMAECKDNQLIVCVKDTGIGMNEEICSRLFKQGEMLSTPGTQNEKGTGLGLRLSQEFIRRHGGNIWAESQPGHGSTFAFSLPLQKKTV